MNRRIKHPSFSDSSWSNPSFEGFASSLSGYTKRKKQDIALQEFLSAVDETPDFHDPYSDLNLFLSEEIKKEMHHCGSCKKWTLKIQEELVKKITPEFQKKFPHYRLGVSALKKTWEKIVYYSQQVQGQKEAIQEDGKLNISFFIKENLRHHMQFKQAQPLTSYHYAHQLASKIGDCIAILDGTKPKLDFLTHMIWSVQKHLLSYDCSQAPKSPYDEYDKIDRLIVKTILDITAKEPHIGQRELEYKVKESLQALHDLPNFSSLDTINCNVSAMLAEKLYPSSAFHLSFFAQQQLAIRNFIQRHSSLYKTATADPQISDIVRRIIALYTLASQLPKDLSEKTLNEAIDASYPTLKTERPALSQAVYAFISAELLLMRNDQYCHSLDYVRKSIFQAYEETKYLPQLQGKEMDILEVVTWKILSETEEFLEKLPYRLGQRIDEEIGNILIDNPSQSFSALVHNTVQFFKKTKELTETKKWNEIDRKIHLWCIQGDMLCRSICFDNDNPLVKLIREKKSQTAESALNHYEFVSEICQEYLRKYPELTIYAGQLNTSVWVLYKLLWYTVFSSPHESSFDRFIKWHAIFFLARPLPVEENYIIHQIEEICKKNVPLLPFDALHCRQLLFPAKVEKTA